MSEAAAGDLDAFMATMIGHATAVSPPHASRLVSEHYGLAVRAERLTGERDENFKVSTADGTEFVFKIANPAEDPEVTDLQTAALLHIEKTDPSLPCPRVRRDHLGRAQIQFEDETGSVRMARLVTYLAGKPLRSATLRSTSQRQECGVLAARMGRALRSFDHPAGRRTLVWDLRSIPKLGGLLTELPGLAQADFIADFIGQFAATVAPRLARVRHQLIHNDFNDRNIIVDSKDESRIAGVIDFGDAVHTALVADVAIAAVAQITSLETMRESIGDLVRGYHGVEPLEAAELDILNWLIAGRIVTGILIPSWHRARNPQANHFDAFDGEHVARRVALARALLSMRIAAP